MRQFAIFVYKETLHIWRDKRTLFILIGMPIAQILIFGFALTNEVKNSNIAILNPSKDKSSKQIIERIEASKYFDIYQELQNPTDIDNAFKTGKIKMVVVFSSKFENELQKNHSGEIQLIADGSDPNTASTLVNYASAIIRDYQNELLSLNKLPYSIKTELRMLYNPQLKGAFNFVPGVMSMILLLVCTLMTSISIVREKELGTMEILLASPVQPFMIIGAKAVPYFVLSLVNIVTILLLSVYVLEIPIRGSLSLLVLSSMLFIITALILGLFISTITDSQMTAMFIAMVGMFLPTVMLSGFMFPIENMPMPLRIMSNIVPAKWYYIIVKSIMIKGLGVSAILKELSILFGMMIIFLGLAVRKFKIRLA